MGNAAHWTRNAHARAHGRRNYPPDVRAGFRRRERFVMRFINWNHARRREHAPAHQGSRETHDLTETGATVTRSLPVRLATQQSQSREPPSRTSKQRDVASARQLEAARNPPTDWIIFRMRWPRPHFHDSEQSASSSLALRTYTPAAYYCTVGTSQYKCSPPCHRTSQEVCVGDRTTTSAIRSATNFFSTQGCLEHSMSFLAMDQPCSPHRIGGSGAPKTLQKGSSSVVELILLVSYVRSYDKGALPALTFLVRRRYGSPGGHERERGSRI